MEQVQHYITTEQYQQLKASWKLLSDAKAITAKDILLYNILRNKPVGNGFTPVTNPLHTRAHDANYGFTLAKCELQRALDKRVTHWNTVEKIEMKMKAFKDRYGIDYNDLVNFELRLSRATYAQ